MKLQTMRNAILKTMRNSILIALAVALSLSSCGSGPTPGITVSGLDPVDFQTQVDGAPTALYTLTNESGMEVCVTNFGSRIVSVMVPDRDGKMCDVVLGFDNIDDYINVPSDFGATIGRYANRIAQGRITIDSQAIQLPVNNFGHTLHGGPKGWQYKIFDAVQTSPASLDLTLVSPDGDQNFPGSVTARVNYTLTPDNAIAIKYSATTDKPTVINMTNHSYFNLGGDPTNPITDHVLWIDADTYTPVDDTFMTTGEIVGVGETPMDFRVPKSVGAEIGDTEFEQLRNGDGYDHNWVLNTAGDVTRPAARLTSPASGITLEMYTSEPGVQVYTGNFLDGTAMGKGGVVYTRRTAICLETQHYPDSPNKPEWPSVELRPGQTYTSECIFKFGVDE